MSDDSKGRRRVNPLFSLDDSEGEGSGNSGVFSLEPGEDLGLSGLGSRGESVAGGSVFSSVFGGDLSLDSGEPADDSDGGLDFEYDSSDVDEGEFDLFQGEPVIDLNSDDGDFEDTSEPVEDTGFLLDEEPVAPVGGGFTGAGESDLVLDDDGGESDDEVGGGDTPDLLGGVVVPSAGGVGSDLKENSGVFDSVGGESDDDDFVLDDSSRGVFGVSKGREHQVNPLFELSRRADGVMLVDVRVHGLAGVGDESRVEGLVGDGVSVRVGDVVSASDSREGLKVLGWVSDVSDEGRVGVRVVKSFLRGVRAGNFSDEDRVFVKGVREGFVRRELESKKVVRQPRREDQLKPGPLFAGGDFADGKSDDELKIVRKKVGRKRLKNGKRGFQITDRDVLLIRFLVRFQFSYVDALARLVNSTPRAIANRLAVLEQHKLVKRYVVAAGSVLWQARKQGIELVGLAFKEGKNEISFATITHTVGLVNLAVELEREFPDNKDVLRLENFGEEFPVKNRFPGGLRSYDDWFEGEKTWGEMTIAEREIRQSQKRYRGDKSTAEMRELVSEAMLDPDAPELDEGNEGMFVVYGSGGKTGEHVPDLVVARERDPDGSPAHLAIELELTPKPPADWKRILRSFREAGGMYKRLYYFTDKKPIANMLRNANEEVGLENLVICRYTPRNPRQPFLG